MVSFKPNCGLHCFQLFSFHSWVEVLTIRVCWRRYEKALIPLDWLGLDAMVYITRPCGVP